MKTVLITSFGSNTSIGVAKCLKKKFRIVGSDFHPYFLCNGFAFADELVQVPRFDSDQYLSEMNRIVEKFQIDCIIPIHDKEIQVLSEAKKNKEITCEIATNRPEVIHICNDKEKSNEVFQNVVEIPTVFKNLQDIQFPLIVKEKNGVSSKNIRIVLSPEELGIINFDHDLVQEYIDNGKEYTVDCYTSYLDDSIFYYSIRKRIETKEGMSTKGEIVDIPLLGKLCQTIHEKLGYQGASNIQFIEKNGHFYFIEINPRFAGGGILTYVSGYNFPLMTLHEICFRETLNPTKLEVGNKMVRYYNESFFDEKNNPIGS